MVKNKCKCVSSNSICNISYMYALFKTEKKFKLIFYEFILELFLSNYVKSVRSLLSGYSTSTQYSIERIIFTPCTLKKKKIIKHWHNLHLHLTFNNKTTFQAS